MSNRKQSRSRSFKRSITKKFGVSHSKDVKRKLKIKRLSDDK